jgi:hypothetical protein
MRCLSCKYDLSNLTEHRCPECGRAFDPHNPATYYDPPMIVTFKMMLRVAIVCYALNLIFAIYVSVKELPADPAALLAAPLGAAALLIFTFPIGIVLYGLFWIIQKSFFRN